MVYGQFNEYFPMLLFRIHGSSLCIIFLQNVPSFILLMPFNFIDIMIITTLDHKLYTFLIISLGSTSVQLLDQRVRT